MRRSVLNELYMHIDSMYGDAIKSGSVYLVDKWQRIHIKFMINHTEYYNSGTLSMLPAGFQKIKGWLDVDSQ